MTISDSHAWNPARLDVLAFAKAGAGLSGKAEATTAFERLQQEQHTDVASTVLVNWEARGEMRTDTDGTMSPWIHVQANALVPVPCQRCLGPVEVPLAVDRWYRFVADEAMAETQDGDSEEDVLALEPKPDLLCLIEDELLLAMPLVPMHERCPEHLPGAMHQPDGSGASNAKPNPFAVLARLKKGA